jgi:2-dehydropantoate 2-reductase
MNGVPWWFFDHLPGANRGLRLESVDPGGALRRAIPTAHVIGCVVHASASRPSPGLVELHMGNHLIIGEPDASLSPRLERLSGLLRASGFEVTASRGIQQDIWYKLWGNMTMNPVSVLTGATGDRVLADPLVVRFCRDAMIEAAAIGERIGCAIAQSPEERQKLTAKLGAFRTSMLQDAEAGRPLEIDALLGVVKEIGEHVGAATPNIDALLGLIRLYGRVRGLYPEEAAT